MKKLVLLLCLVPAFAAAELPSDGFSLSGTSLTAKIVEITNPQPVTWGQFHQEKRIPLFKRPLKSSGEFLIIRAKGVLWDTRKPVSASVRVSEKGIDFPGQETVAAAPAGAMVQASRIVSALLEADFAKLENSFASKGLIHDEGWEIDLLPTDPILKKIFKRIRLSGMNHLRTIVLEETNGDETRIRMDRIREAAKASAAQEALFE